MIRIDRGAEPPKLVAARTRELRRIRPHSAAGALTRQQLGKRYRSKSVASTLWRSHHFKCCYCEKKIECRGEDVEHFRPAIQADRRPGSPASHGYWWLAWTWENLLYSCGQCNQHFKKDRFPLASGSAALNPENMPEGKESRLLLNPTVENPIDHIQFLPVPFKGNERWLPFPRGNSDMGKTTIEVLGLDRDDLRDLYTDHVESVVTPYTNQLFVLRANPAMFIPRWQHTMLALLNPRSNFTALSYDVLDHRFPASARTALKCTLPRP